MKISPPQSSKKSSPVEPKHGKSSGDQFLSLHLMRQQHPKKVKRNHQIPLRRKVDNLQNHRLRQMNLQQQQPQRSQNQHPLSRRKTESKKQTEEPALRQLNRRRKPINKPRQETKEEKAERERLEKIADDAAKRNAAELIEQEQQEKKKLSDRDAKAKQATAANTEKARDVADKMKKKKEAEKAEEKPPRAVARRIKKVPEAEDGDPPGDDETPWTVFTYRQPTEVRADYTYEGAAITNKMNVIDPQYTVNTKASPFGRGKLVTPIDAVLFLQKRQAFAGAKHRIRDIRSVQIERTFFQPCVSLSCWTHV